MKNNKTQFITKQIRSLKQKELKYLSKLKSIILQNKSNIISIVPDFISYDKRERVLILNKNIINKIEKDHGNIILENLIINANDWDYAIRNVDGNKDKINLIKIIPGDNMLLIGANRIDGYFMLTYYEIINNKTKNKLKNLLQRGDSLNNTGGAAVPSSATFS